MSENRRGRRPGPRLPVWAVNPFDAKNSVTCAVISMCIKEDYNQTLPELAERLSELKERPVSECRAVLRDMKKRGTLGYFVCDDNNGFYFRRWEPGRKKKNRGQKGDVLINAIETYDEIMRDKRYGAM